MAAVIVVPAEAPDSVTVNNSSSSCSVSPATSTVIAWLVCPPVNVSTPDGNTPPTKSDATAGVPVSPATAQFTVELAIMPVRLTVKL